MSEWMVGQRCASKGELSLGLGLIKGLSPRNIRVAFPAGQTERTYARGDAPLIRVAFKVGDRVKDNHGHGFVVLEVKENNGLLFYLSETELLPETELDHTTVFSRPHQKLLAGHINKPKTFDLRARTHQQKYRSLALSCRGFIGARIELIPHQLYIASEVARRRHPRVLLSDEVGLGKTIEAGLIFHHLWISGEVKRVLCLVPEPLVNQWLTEFYRKFNTLFSLMTADQAKELAKGHPEMNPYEMNQCILQDIESAAGNPQLRERLLQAPWDLVIVDEAHHLFWSESRTSVEYDLIEALSKVCGGMLLLTATPRQLGLESHFGRLRLLDPHRFDVFETFKEEARSFSLLANMADRALAGESAGLATEARAMFPDDEALLAEIPQAEAPAPDWGRRFVNALIDRHGTGRMVFRNRRDVLSGFPQRFVKPVPLPSNPHVQAFVEAAMPGIADNRFAQRLLAGPPAFLPHELAGNEGENRRLLKRAWKEDPRLEWLPAFLREHGDEKFLLICSQKSLVLALQERFSFYQDMDVAVFHEDLNLIERDRQAAYFAKPLGAQLLICSEIGSEGRNFQFANNLILFDLPLNPALLEQRIGRIDRIGQLKDVHIFIPFPEQSPLEFLYHWYQDGLDAFENHLLEGDYLFEHLKKRLPIVFEAGRSPQPMADFLEETQRFAAELRENLSRGRDRLLELHSFEPERAASVIEAIGCVDEGPELKAFMDEIFELFGIIVEDQELLQTQIIRTSPHMFVESFPGLTEDGMEITYDRETAVSREDLTFLSYDHPMVLGAIDLFLSTDRGITSFALWKQAPEPGLLLQCMFILESPGVEEFGLARYLPPIPIPIYIDQNRALRPDLAETLATVKLDRGPVGKLRKQREALTEIVENLLEAAEEEAETIGERLRGDAENKAMQGLKEEYDRLKALKKVNPSVRDEELDYIEETLHNILDQLDGSKVRLDAVRLIMMVP